MRALILQQPGRLTWEEVPEPDRDGVLVAVRRVGICGTDIHAYGGRQPGAVYPIRLGHELAVEMLEDQPGTLCAVNPYLQCGRCIACRHGRTNCCATLSVMGVHCEGGLTRRLRIPASHLYASDTLRPELLAMAEPLVVGHHAIRRAGLGSGDTVLVVGLGPIGLGVAQLAEVVGAKVVCADVRADRRRAAYRITPHILNAQQEVAGPLKEMLDGDLPRTVIDATGSRQAMRHSYQLVAPGGQMVFVGLITGDFAFKDLDFHRRELTLRASRNGTAEDFAAIMHLLESRRLDPLWMITHRIAFNDLADRFAALADTPNCIKAMVHMDRS
ncbi:MAG: zinc-binding dehydrogenase [Bacteroidota bacterium]|nr:zinc-binding dehydrogenase [Bacteroidota bacterium]MDE2834183.1 zinc-binding dehydrogenase [Bacteroidota bacterium]MDE2958345.1 zinc-binding dehydrogenase [Bacteroidota bacterium]